MISLEQVLGLVRELYARQIDSESDELRERLLREFVEVLTIDMPDRTNLVRYVLGVASRYGSPEVEARASRALKILAVIETLDALEDHKREERDAQMFGAPDARAERDDAPRRQGPSGGEARRREAAGE